MSADAVAQTQGLRWRSHPARTFPGRAVLATGLIIALALVAGSGFGMWWGILTVVVMVISLRRFFFPTEFNIDQERILAKTLMWSHSIRWREARRFVHDHNGGFLSTRTRSSWLDARRGMHILFDARREQIIQHIKDRIQKADAAEPCETKAAEARS